MATFDPRAILQIAKQIIFSTIAAPFRYWNQLPTWVHITTGATIGILTFLTALLIYHTRHKWMTRI